MGWIGLRRKTDNGTGNDDDGSSSNGGVAKPWHIYNLQFSAFTKCANKHVRSVLQHIIEKLSCKCISTESNGLRRISNMSLVFLMYSIHIDIFTKLFQKTFLTHLRIVPRRFWRFVDFNVLCHLIVLTDRFWKVRERACIHISDGMYANNGDVHIRCLYGKPVKTRYNLSNELKFNFSEFTICGRNFVWWQFTSEKCKSHHYVVSHSISPRMCYGCEFSFRFNMFSGNKTHCNKHCHSHFNSNALDCMRICMCMCSRQSYSVHVHVVVENDV